MCIEILAKCVYKSQYVSQYVAKCCVLNLIYYHSLRNE